MYGLFSFLSSYFYADNNDLSYICHLQTLSILTDLKFYRLTQFGKDITVDFRQQNSRVSKIKDKKLDIVHKMLYIIMFTKEYKSRNGKNVCYQLILCFPPCFSKPFLSIFLFSHIVFKILFSQGC